MATASPVASPELAPLGDEDVVGVDVALLAAVAGTQRRRNSTTHTRKGPAHTGPFLMTDGLTGHLLQSSTVQRLMTRAVRQSRTAPDIRVPPRSALKGRLDARCVEQRRSTIRACPVIV